MKRAQKFLALIFMGMLTFMLSCGGGGGGDEAPPPAFTTADLQGTWYFHELQSGDTGPGKSPSGWFYGWATVDANGNCTAINGVGSDGSTETTCTGESLTIDSSGIITEPGSNMHGKMSKGKDLIVNTADDGTGDYRFGIFTKAGGTFITADLQGTWNYHWLVTGDAPQWTGWAYGQMNVDASGNATFAPVTRSDGKPETHVPITLSISSSGIVTQVGYPSFHGKMNQGKDLIVATMNAGGSGGYILLIVQKTGGTFSTADLQGNWWSHGLVSGDAPAQRIGWFWTNWSSNASGNFTALSHRDSTGLTTIPTGATFSVSTNGVVTSASLPSFYGIMNQRKDMIVLTYTGYPSLTTGVGGYVLGITLK